MIEKEAKLKMSRTLNRLAVANARNGLFAVLKKKIRDNPNIQLLIPGYVGWSPNEGSGLMDPIQASAIDFQFYSVTPELLPITEELNKLLLGNKQAVLLLVHYFGNRSVLDESTLSIIKEGGHGVIEDWAHDLSRFFEPRRTLSEDHYEIFSIHKWTSSRAGGLVRGNIRELDPNDIEPASLMDLEVLLSTDIWEVYQARWSNFLRLDAELVLTPVFHRLLSSLANLTCPINYPIVLSSNADRRDLYGYLVSKGLNPTALYHKLTDQLSRNDFPYAYTLADQILNLPIHQDCTEDDTTSLVGAVNSWVQGR